MERYFVDQGAAKRALDRSILLAAINKNMDALKRLLDALSAEHANLAVQLNKDNSGLVRALMAIDEQLENEAFSELVDLGRLMEDLFREDEDENFIHD
jgi:hemoglobin-like flavoprotein